MKVRNVMTKDVIVVNEDQTMQQAAHLLSEYKISGMPVVNSDNVIVGIVTEFDVIARKGQLVRDIMTRSVITVSEETELEEVSRILLHERIRRLLVVSRGRLVGIISRADLVKAAAAHWFCPICGEVMRALEPPTTCIRCGAQAYVSMTEPVAPGF